MTAAPITQEQLNQLVADAKLGRALREAAAAVGRKLAEDEFDDLTACGVEHEDFGPHIADYAPWEDDVTGSEAGGLLRDIVAAAAQAVYDEAHEMRQQHAEADNDIARGLG